jgi:uncharacterized protein YdiU (UPF0061 family)
MLFADSGAFDEWAAKWRHRLAQESAERTERRSPMWAANPAFIPRNHLVEEAIIAAVNDGDFRLSKDCCRWFPRLTRISQRSGDTPIHRDPIRSCAKRSAAPDFHGCTPVTKQMFQRACLSVAEQPQPNKVPLDHFPSLLQLADSRIRRTARRTSLSR